MMASHYGVGVLPTRPRRPKDKAGGRERGSFRPDLHPRTTAAANLLLAGGGQCCDRRGARPDQRPCHAPPRRQPSSSVRDRGKACLGQPAGAGSRVRRMAPGPRRHQLSRRVQEFFYSVPHGLIRQQVDIRATSRTIEIFHRGKRVAAHQRRYGGRRYGTNPEHMPSSHCRYAEWTPARFRRWAASIGPHRRIYRRHPGKPAASRAGLPNVSGHPAPLSGSPS